SKRRNHQCWNSGTGAKQVTLRRRDVIKLATELVISNDNEHVLPLRSCAQHIDHQCNLVVTVGQIGVARVLVQESNRLVKDDRWQCYGLRLRQQVRTVLQVSCPICRVSDRIKDREIVERMMVRLKVGMRGVRRAETVGVVDGSARS